MFHTALRTAGRRAASALLVRAAAPSRRTAPLAAQLASRTLVPRAAALSTSRAMRFPDDADDAFTWQERIYYPPSTLQVGKPAPTFSNVPAVIDGEISELSLSDYRGQWVVLFFYPKDFTFVCPTEIIAFSDRAAEFEKLGAQVIACSADSAETHLAWIRTPRKQGGLGLMQIPIVADFTKDICNNYGVLLTDIGVPLRGLFIINPEGVVEQATINNLPVGRSVDETLRLLTAFQYTAEHGEVCPANWKPGEKTMIADPDASMEYFKTVEDPTTSDADARVKVVSTADELKSAVNQSTPTVAYVRAEWCGKCEQIRPFVEKLSKEYTNVNFVKIDADSGAAAGMNVEVLPSFHFYKGGKEVSQPVTGFKKKMLEEAIKAL